MLRECLDVGVACRQRVMLAVGCIVAMSACGSGSGGHGSGEVDAGVLDDVSRESESVSPVPADSRLDTEDALDGPFDTEESVPFLDAGERLGDSSEDGNAGPSCARVMFGPVCDIGLKSFPSDLFTTAAKTGTGLKVSVDSNCVQDLDNPFILDFWPVLDRLDGFGVTVPVFITVNTKVADLPEGVLRLYEVGGELQEVPCLSSTVRDGDDTLLVCEPAHTLRPATRHVLVVTEAIEDSLDSCVRPSEYYQNLLGTDPSAPSYAEEVKRVLTRLKAIGVEPLFVMPFTTQSGPQALTEFLNSVQGFPHAESQWKTEDKGDFVEVRGQLESVRVTDDEGKAVLQGSRLVPQGALYLDFLAVVPKGASTEAPLIVFQHGMEGSKSNVKAASGLLETTPYVVAAIDAPFHGSRKVEGMNEEGVLGLNAEKSTLSAALALGSMVQLAVDQVALSTALTGVTNWPVDGWKPTEVYYLGVSLGGVMSSALRSDRFTGAVLMLGGCPIFKFLAGGVEKEAISLIQDLLGYSDAQLYKLMVLVQTALDLGDACSAGQEVCSRHSLRGILMGETWKDDIVPNPTTHAMARHFCVPLLEPYIEEVPNLDIDQTPAVFNQGWRTAGLFQFTGPNGEIVKHVDFGKITEARDQAIHFLQTLPTAPEIIDPYSE